MSSPARRRVATLLASATLCAALSASAAPKWVEADEHFRHGVQLFNENNFAAALIEFKRAYEIDPKFQVLYNIAQSHNQLQDYASALKTYQQYLADGGAKVPAKRRKDVEAEIVTLSKRVATLTITTSEPGAAITIDDAAVGTTPMAALTVSAGRRKITATIPGRVPVTKLVDLAGGDRQSLLLEIPPLNAPPPPPKPPPPPAPSVAPTAVTWSITGALAAGAVVTGVLALGASSDLEEELVRYPGDADALASAKDTAFNLGLATDILIGASIAVAAVSTYFTVDFALASDAAASANKPAPKAAFSVRPGGVTLEGTF